MKTVKGIQYAVTANEEVTITDDNGLNLTCPAGQQTYFVATTDEVEVVGDAVVTQTRGGIIAGGGGGGGGEKIAPGEVVVGGTQGSAFIAQLNECTRCPMFIDEELPEGVTFEKLESGLILGASKNYLDSAFPSSEGHFGAAIFSQSSITTLPSTIDFRSLTYGRCMFYSSHLTSFSVDMPLLTYGYQMFYQCSRLVTFSGDLSQLDNGYQMFYRCTKLTSVEDALPKLTTGESMFYFCSALENISSDLSKVGQGRMMFYGCSKLTGVSVNLIKLYDAQNMFTNCGLTSFVSDMPLLTNGSNMFNGCNQMESFAGGTPLNTNAINMFYGCSKLTSFTGDLSALSSGNGMFQACKLDLASVNRIVNSVPSYTSGSHSIQIGVNKNEVTQEQQDAANTILVGKGWTVSWQRN